jgi:hypothetical protein
MKIKHIFDEIKNESSTKKKVEILSKYKDNELLKKVLYLADSPRVKFYIKQIPPYMRLETHTHTLEGALMCLELLSTRSVTGYEAIEHLRITLRCCEPDDAYIVERIIEKDCKINLGTTLINKVFPDLIEETGYMGCKPFSVDAVNKLLKKGNCYSQEKMDGRFVNIIIRNNEVEMTSRQGEPTLLDNPKFITELSKLDDCVLNAELTMKGGISRYESNGIIASLITISKKSNAGNDVSKEIKKFEEKHMGYREALNLIVVTSWDKLKIDEYFNRSSKRSYDMRFEDLNNCLKDCKLLNIVETKLVSSMDEVMMHFNEILKRNGEGTIVKSLDGAWVDSKPSYQIKIKKEINLDLKIVGFNFGTGKNSNVISSINVESEDGLLKTSPTGMSEDMMEETTKNRNQLLGTILEIKCSGISQDNDGNYSVLHPVVKLFRTDKNIANTLIECIEIDNASMLS